MKSGNTKGSQPLAVKGGVEVHVYGQSFIKSIVIMVMTCAVAFSTPAQARKKSVGGLYNISVAGFTVGRGSLSLVFQGNAYSAKIGLEPAGVGTLFSTGKGTAEASGWVAGSNVVPSRYSMSSRAANLDFRARLKQGSRNIRSSNVSPQFKPNPERVKVTRSHHKNAIDPLSAALMPVRSAAKALGPEACNRKLPIFDGWTRFDIKMSYKGTKQVSGHGYEGQVVVCTARWKPVAGHRPSKKSVKHLSNANIEAWLAPMAKKTVLVPYRISIDTSSGKLVVEAEKLNIK